MATSSSFNVLICEDEVEISDVMAELIEGAGFTPIVTNSARTALSELEKNNQLGAILTDNMMPGMSGIAFLREARKRGFQQPAILISALYPQNIRDLMDELNIVALLDKPVPFKQLKDALDRLYESKEKAS